MLALDKNSQRSSRRKEVLAKDEEYNIRLTSIEARPPTDRNKSDLLTKYYSKQLLCKGFHGLKINTAPSKYIHYYILLFHVYLTKYHRFPAKITDYNYMITELIRKVQKMSFLRIPQKKNVARRGFECPETYESRQKLSSRDETRNIAAMENCCENQYVPPPPTVDNLPKCFLGLE